jgi:hypothetical protein
MPDSAKPKSSWSSCCRVRSWRNEYSASCAFNRVLRSKRSRLLFHRNSIPQGRMPGSARGRSSSGESTRPRYRNRSQPTPGAFQGSAWLACSIPPLAALAPRAGRSAASMRVTSTPAARRYQAVVVPVTPAPMTITCISGVPRFVGGPNLTHMEREAAVVRLSDGYGVRELAPTLRQRAGQPAQQRGSKLPHTMGYRGLDLRSSSRSRDRRWMDTLSRVPSSWAKTDTRSSSTR